MARRTAMDVVVEDTLRELEAELESEFGGAEFNAPPPIPNYRWKIYTDDRDNSKNPWRFDRDIPPNNQIDRSKVRKFEEDTLRQLAPIVGPLATQVAIQRCKWDGAKYSPELCRVIDILTKNISVCTHPRPPVDC